MQIMHYKRKMPWSPAVTKLLDKKLIAWSL